MSLPFKSVKFCFLLVFVLLAVLTSTDVYAAAWGDVSLGFYPTDSHVVAPNGLIYDPLMRLQINLDIGKKTFYAFITNSFFTEKATPGVTTNSNQGTFDFTKRENDLQLGLAIRPFRNENIELRAWTISLANLNRGTDANKPSGFKDGFAAEGRYYFSMERLWGYVNGGYFFSKQLVEPDGEPYKPGVFAGANLNYDLLDLPFKLYAYGDIKTIGTNVNFDAGMAWRPFDVWSPSTELRAEYGQYLNVKERDMSQNVFLVEAVYYF